MVRVFELCVSLMGHVCVCCVCCHWLVYLYPCVVSVHCVCLYGGRVFRVCGVLCVPVRCCVVYCMCIVCVACVSPVFVCGHVCVNMVHV